jgi:hypothetical protein
MPFSLCYQCIQIIAPRTTSTDAIGDDDDDVDDEEVGLCVMHVYQINKMKIFLKKIK